MPFNSLLFPIFFAVVLLLHNLPLSWRVRKFNLLWLSYVFYAAWNPPFVLLLWLSTVMDWYLAKWMFRAEKSAHRRWLLVLSLVSNLGMLGFFKYGTFLVENTAALANALGIDWHPAAPSIVLPVGISFYTFQTLSYTLDVYGRRIKPWDSFLDYALFVTFFPQLVAGPIVRARQFLPQCNRPSVVTPQDYAWGMYCFVIGLFQKIVIADGLLASTVESVFDSKTPPTFADGWLGSMAFACQIFCDFAGYSICAIGVARCLGFWLPMNFNYPLASSSFADFWRRWHISLSTWLRDYVYHKLGGSRVAYARWVFNLLFTWTLIGLWHGAAWRFVLWGFMSGSYIVIERTLQRLVPPSPLWSKSPVLFAFAVVQFAGFSISLLGFRAAETSRIVALGKVMVLGTPSGRPMILTDQAIWTTIITVVVLFCWHWFMRKSSLEQVAERAPLWLRVAALAAMLFSIVLMPDRDRAFIYFRF